MNETPPTIHDTLGELNAGVFMQQVEEILKQVALSVIHHGEKNKKGNLTIKLDLARISEDSDMVNIEHTWSYVMPTAKGKKSESNDNNTPMVVSREGYLTVYPLTQTDMFAPGAANVTNLRDAK